MDPLGKRSSLKQLSPTLPPWNPGDGCDIVIANPWRSLRPILSSTFSIPMMISPTCPQHGRLYRRNKSKISRCGALLDGLPSDSFTIKLAFMLGLCKIFCGIIIFLLGLTALPFEATLSGIGAGLWAGMITLISGVAGLMTSKLPHNYAVLVTFLCWSITSLFTSILLSIFSMTGLTKDLSYEDHVADFKIFDSLPVDVAMRNSSADDASSEVSYGDSFFSFDDLFRTERPAVFVNAALVTLAVVDCLVSIMAIILASSETCVCCIGDNRSWRSRSAKETRVRQDRLLRWIQQQRFRLFIQPPTETLHNYHGTLLTNTSRCGPEQLNSAQTYSSLCRSHLSDATTNSAISMDSLNNKNLALNCNYQLVATRTTKEIYDSLTDK